MKSSVYNLLKAKFLVSDDALKNWKFIIFLIGIGMLLIANNHRYDAKNYKISELKSKVKEQRSKFVDTRSTLMKLKMESNVTKKMKQRAIYPADVSPIKIVIDKEDNNKSFLDKLW